MNGVCVCVCAVCIVMKDGVDSADSRRIRLRDGLSPLLEFLSFFCYTRCTACRVYAELAVHYLTRVALSLHHKPFDAKREMLYVREEIPPPMVQNNWWVRDIYADGSRRTDSSCITTAENSGC